MRAAQRLGNQLQRLRTRRGLTQEQLAVNVGLSQTFITRLELGQYDPTLSTLVRLAKALRVSVADLLGESMSAQAQKKPIRSRLGFTTVTSDPDLRVIHLKAPSSRPRSGSRAMRLAGDLPV